MMAAVLPRQRLVWLASYPKSGNTWVRLFLNAYCHPRRNGLDINRIDVSLHAGNRELFDRVIGLEASDLTPAEVERYRPAVYRRSRSRPMSRCSSRCTTAGGGPWTARRCFLPTAPGW